MMHGQQNVKKKKKSFKSYCQILKKYFASTEPDGISQPPPRLVSPGSSAQSVSSHFVTPKYVLMFSGLPGAHFLESVLVFALRATFPVLFNRIILILLGRGI
jgi:hypothetical protein